MSLDDVYVLKDVFNGDQINWLKSVLDKLKDNDESYQGRTEQEGIKNKLFSIKKHFSLWGDVESFLRSMVPFEPTSYEFHSMNFYELQLAYGLHCDNLGPKEGFYQAIVPIEIKPNRPTYSVIFDQTSEINTEWISKVYNKSKDYKPFHNTPIYDASWYGGWSDEYRISEEDGVKFWGETWDETYREAYKGFSIKHAYEWSVGDLFLFNSKYNHCASELQKLNINQKTGLLACFKKSESHA